MNDSHTLENILKKDRFIVVSGLFVLCFLSWLYIIYLYRQMAVMKMDASFFAMPMTSSWTIIDFMLLFLMWLVMMIAMMVPSVTPLLLLFASFNRKKQQQNSPYVSTGYFLTGYLIVWTGFSLAASALQWLFQYLRLLSPMMITTNTIAGSIILLGAGIFQFTSLKNKCLAHCRNPVDFITRYWRDARGGALRMGLQHGYFCLGCCWILMCVLFVTGIMSLLWIALISIFVLLEKVVPQQVPVSRIAGIILIAGAVWLLT